VLGWGLTICVWPSIVFAVAPNAEYAGFLAPAFEIRPLNQVLFVESRRMNQTNISTYGFSCASWSAALASRACCVWLMPPPTAQRAGHSGAVCSAHSVTQIGTRRWNHCLSESPSFVRFDMPTFG